MSEESMDRRKHPDYASITAYLPKEKIKEIKKVAVEQDLTLSEAVEQAVDAWMNAHASSK